MAQLHESYDDDDDHDDDDDDWIRETGTVQQVAQLHDRHLMTMVMVMRLICFKLHKVSRAEYIWNFTIPSVISVDRVAQSA